MFQAAISTWLSVPSDTVKRTPYHSETKFQRLRLNSSKGCGRVLLFYVWVVKFLNNLHTILLIASVWQDYKLLGLFCYDLNRRAIVNLRDCLECSRIHRDGNVLGLPPKNLRIEGVEAINRGNQRRNEDFSRPFAGGVVSAWGESRGQSSSEFAGPTRRRSGVHEGRWRRFV
jgi:hypothetical protein